MRCSRHTVGICVLETGAQQVGEQAVVAPPASFLVQGNQEQVGPLDLLQGGLAAPWPVTASQRPGRASEESTSPAETAPAGRAGGRALPRSDSRARSGGCPKLATNPAGSDRPCRSNAASWSPATQPSVRVDSAARLELGRSRPVVSRSSAAVSSSVKRRSCPRSSASWPRTRSRASGGGSARLATTTWSWPGRRSSRNPRLWWTGGASMTW